MATDQEIAAAIETLLRDPNPNLFTSLHAVVHHLESRLGRDLSHKFDFIRTQIHHALLRAQAQPQPQPLPQQPCFQPSPQPPLQHPHHHQQMFMQQQHQQHNFRDHFALRHVQQQQGYHHSGPSSYATQYLSFGPQPPAKSEPLAIVPAEASKANAQPKPKRKGGAGGLNKPCGVTPELQAIVGHAALPRTEIVKQLWAYIRKNNLQDPSNKRIIICNDELRLVFETDCTDMFKMNKLLSKHIIALEPTKTPAKKLKAAAEEPVTKTSQSPPPQNVILFPPPIVIISESLADLFGTDEKKMLQSEVEAKVQEYIKANNLEDPNDANVIRCDARLQEIFQCDSLPASGITELMVLHNLFSRE